MKLEYTFLHVDTSDALVEHFQSRFEKLLKFEMKPMDVHVIFSSQRHECIVDVQIMEGRRKYKAQGIANDFDRSVDMVVNKLWRQMSKEKKKLKDYKHRFPSPDHDLKKTG
jgi:ribosomal subunit interface protein